MKIHELIFYIKIVNYLVPNCLTELYCPLRCLSKLVILWNRNLIFHSILVCTERFKSFLVRTERFHDFHLLPKSMWNELDSYIDTYIIFSQFLAQKGFVKFFLSSIVSNTIQFFYWETFIYH
jgi:hypothetical protein